MISSFVASIGFGILFNIKRYNLFLAGVSGSIGGVIHYLCVNYGLGEVMSLFLASVAFSFFSEICSRIQKTPVTTFVICALIPLVPGGGMYRMAVEAINNDSMMAVQIGVETIGYAGTLALGVIFVSTITRVITNGRLRRKSIEKDVLI